MTENEALKLGKSLYENLTSNANNIIPTKEYIEFVEIAIQALEEREQYRAIGTIEEFKAMKEKNETLKALYENARKEGNNLIIKARTEAVNEFVEKITLPLTEDDIHRIAEEMKGELNND